MSLFKSKKEKKDNTGMENAAARIVEEPQNDENEQRDESVSRAIMMDRGIFSASAVERAAGYSKVKSTASVRSLIRHADNYEAALKRFRIPQKSGTDQDFLNKLAETNGEVAAYMQEMMSYLTRKAEGYAEKGKSYSGMMGVCAAEANRIRTQLDLINKIQEKCFYSVRSGEEVPYGKSYEELLQNIDYTRIQQMGDSSTMKKLGSGQINSVYLAKDEQRGTERVLKEGQKDMAMDNEAATSVYSRIKIKRATEKKYTMNTAYRDVAVSMIDKLFGLNAVVDTSFVRSASGKQSSLMDKASGATMADSYVYKGAKNIGQASLIQQIKMNESYLVKGIDTTLTAGELQGRNQAAKKQLVDVGSDQFLESTFNLAALDLIVGHVDRHSGNIMISADGVKGIDNDSAFSLRSLGGELKGDAKNISDEDFNKYYFRIEEKDGKKIKHEVANPNQAALYLNTTFPYVTEAFREKIVRVSPEAVAGTLQGLLEKEEIDACVERVKDLQKYLNDLPEDRVVDSFHQINQNYGEEYSSQITRAPGMFADTHSNIMSQVVGVGKGDLLKDYTWKEYKQLSSSMGSSGEIPIMRMYVERMTGYKDLDALKITYYMMKEMAKRATSGGFDVYNALADGTMIGILNRAENMVKAEKKEEQT